MIDLVILVVLGKYKLVRMTRRSFVLDMGEGQWGEVKEKFKEDEWKKL